MNDATSWPDDAPPTDPEARRQGRFDEEDDGRGIALSDEDEVHNGSGSQSRASTSPKNEQFE